MQTDLETTQDEKISGPLCFGLSGSGVEYFVSRGQKARKVHFFDGGEEFGIEFPDISIKVLQKLAMTGMVSRVERSITQFGTQRASLMDLTRCFATSVVYRQFETRLWEILVKSDVLIQWNRSYPKLTVSPDQVPQGPAIQLLVEKAKAGILAAKQEILSFVQNRIQLDVKSLPEEKKALTLLAIRYINAIDPVVWTLLATCKDPYASTTLSKALKDLLGQYISRSELPEYLACLLVELVILMNQGKAESAVMADADSRVGVHVSFDLGVTRKSQEERTRLRILIGSDGCEAASIKALVESQSGAPSKGLAGAAGVGAGLDLGRYYLSYVMEACRKMDISVDSFVNMVPHSKKVLVNLILTI